MRITIVSVTGLILLAAAVAFVLHNALAPVNLAAPVTVTIAKGEKTSQIAARLESAGVLRSSYLFTWLARWQRIDRHLRPGRYQFTGPTRMIDVLRTLHDGRAVVVTVTIPEGWTVARIASHLSAQLGFTAEEFMGLTRDTALLRQADCPGTNLEGYLWPDTYQFYWGAEPREVLERLLVTARAVFSDSLAARARALGFNRHQVLTLASLIEGEAAAGDERAHIAGVFHNRLRLGMPLQCDPSVIYALGGLPPGRVLQEGDLTYDSPYNTYVYPDLPPGPINNPGRASITAALYPDSTKDLYFVATGDGRHVFSMTLEEHNRARARVRRSTP